MNHSNESNQTIIMTGNSLLAQEMQFLMNLCVKRLLLRNGLDVSLLDSHNSVNFEFDRKQPRVDD